MNHQFPNKKQLIRRGRSGMSAVEFTLLLPFLALMAASLFSLEFLFYRSIGQSQAAFSAARQGAVRGRSSGAAGRVRSDYRAFSMPGTPAVSAQFIPGHPGRCEVTVRDRFSALTADRNGRLFVQDKPGAVVVVTAAGTSPGMGGDNDR